MLLRVSFLFLFFFQLIFAQYSPSVNYTTAEGLPNNAIRSLFIDNENRLWIGTENGVSRLENGVFFTLDISNGLGHNSCWDISQDDKGNMWFASYGGGVSKFNGKKFSVFTSKDGLPSDKTRKVFPFKNKIYVGTEQGIAIIDLSTNKVITPKVPKVKDNFICMDFFVFKDEIYFVALFEGLFKIDQKNDSCNIISIFKNKNNYSLFLDEEFLYVGNEGFVQQFEMEKVLKNDFSFHNFGSSIIWDFIKTNQGNIFAAADGVYNPDGGLYQISGSQMINASERFGIDSRTILSVVHDSKKDILYVGSNDKGIYEIPLNSKIAYHPFSNKSCIDFEVINTTKFVLHTNGVSLLDTSHNVIKEITNEVFKSFEMNYLIKHPRNFSTNYRDSKDFELNFNIPAEGIIFYELVKHKSSLWVGSNLGIFELNINGDIINYIPKHSQKIGFTTDDKFIETITFAGLYVYDDVYNLKGKHYSKLDNNTPQYIVKILNHGNKTYLISVFNGLFAYENGKFRSYLYDNIWNEKKFKHITVNSKGQLVLAAEFGDVFVIEDNQRFKIIKKISKNEIIGKTINFLESYKDYLLIGTEKGINIYHNGIFRFIDKEQGLKDYNIKTSQIFDTKLWLGTQKGFYILDLDSLLTTQPTVNSISISSILVNNEPISVSNYNWFRYQNKEIVCDYKQNSFYIDFVPKGHLYPNKLKFRYRLNKNNRWSPYNEKPNVFLSYLPYGNYNLEIEVFDKNTGETKIFEVLKIIILPPFWLRWWFLLGILLTLLTLVAFIFKRYKNKVKEKALIEKRIAETKLDALLSQMNPHFTFNAMNTIQDFIISNDIDNSLLFISDLAKLMRLTLDNSAKKSITLEEEISFLKTYIKLENLRFGNRISVSIEFDKAIDYHIRIPVMLLQPFVENVFVHAFNENHPNPQLNITFTMKSNELLECKIIDNGNGKASFSKLKLHESKALKLAEERLKLIQPEIENPIATDFTENDGSRVSIVLKV